MYVGTQSFGTSQKEMEFLTRHGVTHLDASVPDTDVDTLVKHKEEAAKYGVNVESIHFGLPRSIPLAQDPKRDEDIDKVCKIIENAGRAGLRALNYNFCIVSHQRTPRTVGRGNSTYSTFKLDEYDNETLTEAGEVSRDEAFERIEYFLKRVIPVAEEYKVQMACHLNDPPAVVLKGVERWNYPVYEGLKRFVELVDSPYNGFNFCCGVASEGLDNPADELGDIVRYFGERKKIFNVHFRNIRGGLHNFQETWPDEGDVDMFEIARIFHEVDYPYMLMPDHAPQHPDDVSPEGVSKRVRQAWAFQYGYIIAMIQAVSR
ncbi:MAG: mannonate dehydratase [Candidatus Latescibacterota bacterium]|jgi:mannonate dehydratase